MHRSVLIAAICMSLPIQAALSEDALRITNVTINMIKHGGRGSFRIDAKIANPNDFAVFDVRVRCTSKTGEATNWYPTPRRYWIRFRPRKSELFGV